VPQHLLLDSMTIAFYTYIMHSLIFFLITYNHGCSYKINCFFYHDHNDTHEIIRSKIQY